MPNSYSIVDKSCHFQSKMTCHNSDNAIYPNSDLLKDFQTLNSCGELIGVPGCDMIHTNGNMLKPPSSSTPCAPCPWLKVNPWSSPGPRSNGNVHALPLFNGLDSREFFSWLYEVESYFNERTLPEKKKCELVVSCLRDNALCWYHNITCAKKGNMNSQIKYWHKLKCCLKCKFLTEPVILRNELENLKQGSLDIESYIKVFNELCFVFDKGKDPGYKRSRFYLGLKSEIARWINVEDICSLELLCHLALMAESLIHENEDYVKSLAESACIPYIVAFESEVRAEDVPNELLAPVGTTVGKELIINGVVDGRKIHRTFLLPEFLYDLDGGNILRLNLKGFHEKERCFSYMPETLGDETLKANWLDTNLKNPDVFVMMEKYDKLRVSRVSLSADKWDWKYSGCFVFDPGERKKNWLNDPVKIELEKKIEQEMQGRMNVTGALTKSESHPSNVTGVVTYVRPKHHIKVFDPGGNHANLLKLKGQA